jgi:hypothetical protein
VIYNIVIIYGKVIDHSEIGMVNFFVCEDIV